MQAQEFATVARATVLRLGMLCDALHVRPTGHMKLFHLPSDTWEWLG